MKNTLRFLFVALALATTGLFAQTTPVTPATSSQHFHAKPGAKKGHGKHKKKHKKHVK